MANLALALHTLVVSGTACCTGHPVKLFMDQVDSILLVLVMVAVKQGSVCRALAERCKGVMQRRKPSWTP